MDRRASCATVHGVAKSWTGLKQLSMHAYMQHGRTLNFYSPILNLFLKRLYSCLKVISRLFCIRPPISLHAHRFSITM